MAPVDIPLGSDGSGGAAGSSSAAVADIHRNPVDPLDSLRFAKDSWSEEWDVSAVLRALAEQASIGIAGSAGTLTVEADTSWLQGAAANGQELGFRNRGTASPASFASADLPAQAGATAAGITLGGLEFYTDEDEHNHVAYNGIEITIDVAAGHNQHNSQWFPTPRDLTINVPAGETNAQFVEFWSTRTFGSNIESLRVRAVSGMETAVVSALTGEVTGGINSTAGIRVSFSRGMAATYGDLGNAFSIQTQTETAPITNVNSSVTVSGIQFSGSGAGDGTHYDGWQIIINAPSGASMALAVNANARTVTCTPATGSTIQQAFTDWSALVNANVGRVFDTIQSLILTVVGTAGDPIAAGSGTMAGGVDAAPGTNPSFTLAGSVFTLVQNPTSTIADLRALMNGHTGITTSTYGTTPTGPVSGDIMFTGGENAEYAPSRELVPPHAETFVWAAFNAEEIGARVRFVPTDSDWGSENVAGTAGNAWDLRVTHDPTQPVGTVGFVVNLAQNEIGINTNPQEPLLGVIQALENNALGRWTVDRIGGVTDSSLRVSVAPRSFTGGEDGIIGKVRIRNGDTWEQIRALIDADSRFTATIAPPTGSTTIASLIASTGTDRAFANGVDAQPISVVEDAAAKRATVTYNPAEDTLGEIATVLQERGFTTWYRRLAAPNNTPETPGWIRQVGPVTLPGNVTYPGSNLSMQDIENIVESHVFGTDGYLADTRIHSDIMRDAEFTASAIRALIGLTEAEQRSLLIGATLNGQTLTLSQEGGTDITLTLPQSTGMVGAVEDGRFSSDGTELILDLAGGESVTISVPSLLRGTGAADAVVRVWIRASLQASPYLATFPTFDDPNSDISASDATALIDSDPLSETVIPANEQATLAVTGLSDGYVQVVVLPDSAAVGDVSVQLKNASSLGVELQVETITQAQRRSGHSVLMDAGQDFDRIVLNSPSGSASSWAAVRYLAVAASGSGGNTYDIQPIGNVYRAIATTTPPDRPANNTGTGTISGLTVAPSDWSLTRPEATEALPYVFDCHVYYETVNGVSTIIYGVPNRTDRYATGLNVQQQQVIRELIADPHGRELLDRITAEVNHTPGTQITNLRIGFSEGIRDPNFAVNSIGTSNTASTGAGGINQGIVVGSATPSVLAGDWAVQVRNAANEVLQTIHKHEFLRIINASDRVIYESVLYHDLAANLTLRVIGATISLLEFTLTDGATFGDVTWKSGTADPGNSERILGTVVMYAKRGTSGSFESLHLHAGGSDDSWQTLATSGGGSLTTDALLDLFKETRVVADRNKVLAIAAGDQDMLALRTIIGAAADDVIDIRPMQPLYMKNTGAIPSIINLGAYTATTSTSGGYVLWSTRPTGWSVSVQPPDPVNDHEWILPAWQVRTREGWQTTAPTIIFGHVTLEDIYVEDESARVWIDALTDQATFERQAPAFVVTGSTIDAAAAAPLLANEPFDNATIPANGIAVLSLSLPVGSLLQVVLEPNAGTVGNITVQTRSSSDTATILQTFTITAAQQTSGAAVNLAITTAANQVVITASSTGAAVISAVHALRLSNALTTVATDGRTLTGLGTPDNPLHIANLFAIPAWVSGTSYAQGAFTRVATTIYIKSSVGTGTTQDPSTTNGRSEWAVLASLVPLAATLTDDGYRNLSPTWTVTIPVVASQADGALSVPTYTWNVGPPAGATHVLVTFELPASIGTEFNFALRFNTPGGGQSSLHDLNSGNAYIQAGTGITGRLPVGDLQNGTLSLKLFYHDGSPADVTGATVTVTAVPQHRVTIAGRTRNVYGAGFDTIEEGEIVTTDGDTAVTNPTWNLIRFDRAVLWSEIDAMWFQWSASSGASGDRWLQVEGLAWERMGRVAAGATYNIPTAGATRIHGFIFGGVSDGDDVLQQVPKIQPTYFHVNYPLTQGSHVFLVVPEAAEHQSLYCIGFRLAVFAPSASYRRPALWKVDMRRIEGGR